jgi:NADH:ubiquinone oxidoreductase subunit 2 (subunit N)
MTTLNVFSFFSGQVIENFNCYLGIYSEIFLIITLSLLLIFLVIFDYIYKFRLVLLRIAANLFSLILILTGFLVNNNFSNFFVFDYLLIQDNFSIFVKDILIFSLLCCVLMSYTYIVHEKIVQYEYYILLGLSFLGLFTLVMSNDLITMYLGIELQSLSFYVLAATKIHSNYSTEAGLKYFILGAFSSGILLFGSSLIYGFTGTTNFYDLQLLFRNNDIPVDLLSGILLGSIFITVGILFKLGAAPFHM